MPKRPLTVDDLWTIPRVGQPVPAVDGSFAIVPVTSFAPDTGEKATRLYRCGAPGEPPRALTTAEASSDQPALSPDGRKLAFIRKPGGKKAGEAQKDPPQPGQGGRAKHTDVPQLYVMPLEGGEAERLTDLPLGVEDPRWFADGLKIAFLAPLYVQAPTPDASAELARKRGEDPVKAVVTEDRVYRYWDRWLADGKVHHVFVLDLATRAMIDLTPASSRWFPLDDASGHFRIAPDGREIAFTATRSLPPHDPLVWAVFKVPVPENLAEGVTIEEPSLLAPDHPAHTFSPVYSPDGRRIVYGMQREIDFYADRHRLVAFDRRSGRHDVLTEPWDRSATDWEFAEDSRTLFVGAETESRTSLFVLDVPSALEDPARHQPRPIARGGTFSRPSPAGGRIFTTLQTLSDPPEVVRLSADGSERVQLTEFTRAHMEGIALGKVEEMVFKGSGGRSVQMLLVRPPTSPCPSGSEASRSGEGPGATPRGGGADRGSAPPSGRLPLVQVIHGGPHAASGDQWHWRWNAQAFAAPGYLVAMVNFHGSTGWGQEFAASILGRWGDQPFQDIMAATDWLIERGLADPEKMAAAGGSYGGYLASWIASQTDRFACIINHAGVCDFQTQFASDVTQGRRRAMGGSLWEGIEGMDRYNPIRHASGFRSPMLVIHGERDYRVPYNQALEIYNVLKAMKVPARLVCYPDENHWILKPHNSRHWYGEVLGWLSRWIGSGSGEGQA